MARLDLRLDKLSLGADLRFGVVARVCQIKDVSGKLPDDPQEREVVMPAGKQSTRTVDGLALGTYRIEARLPSGHVLRKTQELTDEQQAALVVFQTGRSPREWLSLQRLAGNVPPASEYEGWISKLTEPARTAVSGSLPVATQPPELELLQVEPGRAALLWDGATSMTAWMAWRNNAQPDHGLAVERTDDRQVTLWQITQADRRRRMTAASGNPMPVRSLAVMRRGNGVEVIPLPVPWPMLPWMPPASLEILREAASSESGRTTLTVRDESVGSLIMYLNNGQISDAAVVFAEADREGIVQDLIEAKSENPFAACAAAYVGIATLPGEVTPPSWTNWLGKLKNLFEWLPDGAVIHGAYHLKTAQNRQDLDAALASFKSAYRRGIPFYVAGLQHLMNGLYTFSERDAEAKAMYDKVSAVASGVDRDQAFTQISIVTDQVRTTTNARLSGESSTTTSLGKGLGLRFNSEGFPKLAPGAPAVKWPPRVYGDWDPELRASAYVNEFMTVPIWPGGPIGDTKAFIEANGSFLVPTVTLDQSGLSAEILGVLNASIDRADRALEILDQATRQGALRYWTGMLGIDPMKEKNTFLLMLVAQKIGEFVAMGLKDYYRMRRPHQIYPLIMPLIDVPDTPSFPSSHSLQAHLISGALKLALTSPVNPVLPMPGALPPPPAAPILDTAQALEVLAHRVAYNCEVAGVNYHMDSQAGLCAALKCVRQLFDLPPGGLFKTLVNNAALELADLP